HPRWHARGAGGGVRRQIALARCGEAARHRGGGVHGGRHAAVGNGGGGAASVAGARRAGACGGRGLRAAAGATASLTQRLSASCVTDALTDGCTSVNGPLWTHARWLGAKRGARRPSLISRVTAKRLNCVAGMKRRSFERPPSEKSSRSTSTAVRMPSPLTPPVSTRATSALYSP